MGDDRRARPRSPAATPSNGSRRGFSRRRPKSCRPDADASLDLLAVALSSGAGLHQAMVEVAEFDGPDGPLRLAAAKLQRGIPLLDVLDSLPDDLGEGWQPVATTLAVTATSGAPAIEAVRRLSSGLRLRRRRTREERIRRLPVLLLFPLATMTLPAFVLVTFVPVAVAVAGRTSS
jgi:pilus assembly protein TadC